MKYIIATLGCKVNQYETQAMESFLIERGHERAVPGETAELMMCFPLRFMASAPLRRAQLSLSEPQEVKTSSSGLQSRAEETCRRAVSSSFFASRPRVWVELGLP